jgi:hypothetical protein
VDNTLKDLGFVQSPLEHGLYVRGAGGRRLLVGIYVADLIIIGGSSIEISKFKKQMRRESLK